MKFRTYVKNIVIKIIDAQSPLSGALNKSGGVLQFSLTEEQNSKLSDIVFDMRKRINHKLELILNRYQGQGIFCHDIIQEYPELIELVDERLIKAVKEYLGDDAVLDKICLFVLPLTKKYSNGENSSDMWHHDSVGHRIKVFFPIKLTDGDASAHEYRKNTNFIKIKSYLNSVNNGQRLDASYDNYEVVRIPMTQGNGLMIDTHGVHRGIYNNFDGLRASILLEFSKKSKSKLTGYVGPVEYLIPLSVYQLLKKFGIVNDRLISNAEAAQVRQKGRKLMGSEAINFVKLIE